MKRNFSLFFVLMSFFVYQLKGQPLHVLKGSYPNIFTYFTPGSSAMPPGAAVASKATMLLQATDFRTYDEYSESSSAFLIRTFRDDNKICACMSAHQLDLPYTNIAAAKARWPANSNLYMNYLGADSVSNGIHYNKTIRVDKGYLGTVSVRAYFYDTTTEKDIALVWIDKDLLPSASYSMLGYDFNKTGWSNGRNYAMGHPLAYPQRLSDNLELLESDVDGNTVELETKLPYATSPGSSGGPVIQVSTDGLNSWVVKGVLTEGYEQYEEDLNLNERFIWATKVGVNNIGLLENAIRRHCWKKEDSAQIASSQSYKQSLVIDNTSGIAPYSQDQRVSTAANITASPGVTSQTEGVRETIYKANVFGMSGFALPTTYPGSTDPWAVTVAAKEINVSSDFNYEASGLSELNLASVVISTGTQSTARWVDSVQAGTAVTGEESSTRFDVYPNPSPEGIFNVKLPATGTFRLAIHDLDGKYIFGADCTGSPFRFALPAVARGSYLLTVYNKQHDELVYRKLIIY